MKVYEYVFGDVHGHLDQLEEGLKLVEQHARTHRAESQLFFLGDYVDRGPNSRGVIERLMCLEDATCLMGNHEVMMLDTYQRRYKSNIKHWLSNGGKHTLRSYGAKAWPWHAIFDEVPEEHLAWLKKRPTLVRSNHRVFVHAGLMPGFELHLQDAEACLWIRERFLRAKPHEFPVREYIVHGHTPYWSGRQDPTTPEILEHRCNLDTGIFFTGILTIGVFDASLPGKPIEILQVHGEPSHRDNPTKR